MADNKRKNIFASFTFSTTLLLAVIIVFFFNFNVDVFKAGAAGGYVIGQGTPGFIVKFVDDLTLTVSFSSSPGLFVAGQPESFSAVVGGTVTGTTNYNIWWNCNYNNPIGSDPTPTVAEANSFCGAPNLVNNCSSNQALGFKCDNHGPVSGTDSYTTPGYAYMTGGSKRPFVIVERGPLTAMSVLSTSVNVISIPAVSNLSVSVSNSRYCSSGVHATVAGVYSNATGDAGDAYEVIINGGADIGTDPNTVLPNSEWESGTVAGVIPNGGNFSASTPAPCNIANSDTSPQSLCQMDFGTTYTAWARVRSGTYWSPWIKMSLYSNSGGAPVGALNWSTPAHPFPNIVNRGSEFAISPSSPQVGSLVTFVEPNNVFSGAAAFSSRSWNFGDGTAQVNVYNAPAVLGGTNQSHTYNTKGSYLIRYTAEDDVGVCSVDLLQNISVQATLPKWREVAPR